MKGWYEGLLENKFIQDKSEILYRVSQIVKGKLPLVKIQNGDKIGILGLIDISHILIRLRKDVYSIIVQPCGSEEFVVHAFTKDTFDKEELKFDINILLLKYRSITVWTYEEFNPGLKMSTKALQKTKNEITLRLQLRNKLAKLGTWEEVKEILKDYPEDKLKKRFYGFSFSEIEKIMEVL